MKLELKHLAPYLPYKLLIDSAQFEDTRVMGGMNNSSEEVCIDAVFRMQYKPFLRPLSELIELDVDNKPKYFPSIVCINLIDCSMIEETPYSEIIYLLSNHFDIFGLIEKGLAIDINEIGL